MVPTHGRATAEAIEISFVLSFIFPPKKAFVFHWLLRSLAIARLLFSSWTKIAKSTTADFDGL
jgi:hypothetical protein